MKRNHIFSLSNMLVAILLLLSIAACSTKGVGPDNKPPETDKDTVVTGNPNVYFKFKLDNVEKVYRGKYDAFMNVLQGREYLSFVLIGVTDTATTKEVIGITLSTKSKIAPGITYTNFTSTQANEQKESVVILHYHDHNGVIYGTNAEEFEPLGTPPADLRVTITELNAEFVKGKFKGTVFNDRNRRKALIDGEFSLRYETK